MKLLIIDDNPYMRKLIRSSVAATANTVNECVDGSKVLDAYSNLPLKIPHLSQLREKTRRLTAHFQQVYKLH